MEFTINDLLSQDKKRIKEQKPLGRPKKNNSDLQNKRVVSYLTEKEIEILENLSKNDVLSVSNYIRKVLVNHIKYS